MFKSMECPECREKITSFFEGLSDEEYNRLQEEKVEETYKPGEVLFRAGNRPVGLFWVNHGMVKLYKPGAQGRDQIVRLSTEGELLGYRSMICNERYAATAETLEKSEIGFVSLQFFQEVMKNNLEVSRKLLGILCHDLKRAEEHTAGLSQQTVRERLADILLYLQHHFGTEEDGKTLKIRLSRKDMAALTGTANETLIRLLRNFKDEGLIDLERKLISIEEPEKLKRISQGFAPV